MTEPADKSIDGGAELPFDAEAETVATAWEGEFLYTSWGYGQTNTELAQIVAVSDTGKTVLARLVQAETVERDRASEKIRPVATQYGDEFRLHVRCNGTRDPSFRGTYPYITGDPDDGTRMGSFGHWDDRESIHQTAPNHGH
jgi:hypothetical protein